jgi:hypothetical protein
MSGFHELVRPKIIRESSLEVLSGLCEIMFVQLPDGPTQGDIGKCGLFDRDLLEMN